MRKKKLAEPEISEQLCKNCETEFKGNFCPNCGQSVKEFERPFGFLFVDLMGNIFAFDTRFWKTFKAILFNPGKMALEFVKGRRVRYMPPFRFYVFVSFIFFFFLNILTNKNIEDENITIFGNTPDSDSLVVAPVVANTKHTSSDTVDYGKSKNGFIDVEEESSKIVDYENINKNPDIYIGRMFQYLSWSIFFLMPFYGFLLWLFFRKSQPYYITHLILAVNQHSFTFLVFLIMMILSYVFNGNLAILSLLLFLSMPVYIFVGLRRLFKRAWWSTLLLMFAMAGVYFSLLFSIFIVVIFLSFDVPLSEFFPQ